MGKAFGSPLTLRQTSCHIGAAHRVHVGALHQVRISAWTGWDGVHRAGADLDFHMDIECGKDPEERKEISELGSLAHVCFYLNLS